MRRAGKQHDQLLRPQVFGGKHRLEVNIVTGYPGGNAVDLAIERGELRCRP